MWAISGLDFDLFIHFINFLVRVFFIHSTELDFDVLVSK